VELKTGEVYRGSMVECEDNWNCQLDNITFTAKVPFLPSFEPCASSS
jgi:small nuclear ribonucleoprotein (snRNP)-like protein